VDSNKVIPIVIGVVLTVVGSLVGYVFYGHIQLDAKVSTMESKQEQVIGEQRDLWGKYNDEAMYKVEFMKEYYNDKVEDEKRWGEYWKEKYEESKK
jgi:hypothetical protein